MIESVLRRLRGGKMIDDADITRTKVKFVPSEHPLDNDKPTDDNPDKAAAAGRVRVKYTIEGYTTLNAENYPPSADYVGLPSPESASANEIAKAEFDLTEDDPWTFLQVTVPDLQDIQITLTVVTPDK